MVKFSHDYSSIIFQLFLPAIKLRCLLPATYQPRWLPIQQDKRQTLEKGNVFYLFSLQKNSSIKEKASVYFLDAIPSLEWQSLSVIQQTLSHSSIIVSCYCIYLKLVLFSFGFDFLTFELTYYNYRSRVLSESYRPYPLKGIQNRKGAGILCPSLLDRP